MNTNILQTLCAFLRTAPAMQGIALTAEQLPPAPFTAGLWGKGTAVKETRQNLWGETHREDILGIDHATYKLTFVAQLPYGAAVQGNIAAADFFARLTAWLRGAERAHNYPDLAGYEVLRIETANAGMPTGADANAARYQLQLTLYTKEL